MQLAARAENWCVAINKERSSTTLFTLSKQTAGTINLGNTPLPRNDEATYLGITFDKKQTWKRHIQKAELKARHKLVILQKLAGTSWGANETILKRVYQGAVRPHLEYGSTAWSTTAKTNQQVLDKVQNQALRITTGSMKSTPIKAMEKTAAVRGEMPKSWSRQRKSKACQIIQWKKGSMVRQRTVSSGAVSSMKVRDLPGNTKETCHKPQTGLRHTEECVIVWDNGAVYYFLVNYFWKLHVQSWSVPAAFYIDRLDNPATVQYWYPLWFIGTAAVVELAIVYNSSKSFIFKTFAFSQPKRGVEESCLFRVGLVFFVVVVGVFFLCFFVLFLFLGGGGGLGGGPNFFFPRTIFFSPRGQFHCRGNLRFRGQFPCL